MEIALSFGSNQGDRLRHLCEARARVVALPGVRLLAAAPVYETDPVEVAEEFRGQSFLNSVLIVDCSGGLHPFSTAMHAIEDAMGRVRAADRNAPRVIDIDIIYAGADHRSESQLQVPHPRWQQRRFVVQPLADVRPDAVLPGESCSVRAVLQGLPEVPRATLYRRDWETS
jgi:2-amino-4-hydroxy-6-hydroxymethyldihydropteridine diphosphokinase